MGTISGFFAEYSGMKMLSFSAQLTTVSCAIIGPVVFLIIIVLGFYLYKQFDKDIKRNDKDEDENEDTDEDIKLGAKKGVIKKKNDS